LQRREEVRKRAEPLSNAWTPWTNHDFDCVRCVPEHDTSCATTDLHLGTDSRKIPKNKSRIVGAGAEHRLDPRRRDHRRAAAKPAIPKRYDIGHARHLPGN